MGIAIRTIRYTYIHQVDLFTRLLCDVISEERRNLLLFFGDRTFLIGRDLQAAW
jgi:hypothetical protein